jgi:hypothetical protein
MCPSTPQVKQFVPFILIATNNGLSDKEINSHGEKLTREKKMSSAAGSDTNNIGTPMATEQECQLLGGTFGYTLQGGMAV